MLSVLKNKGKVQMHTDFKHFDIINVYSYPWQQN